MDYERCPKCGGTGAILDGSHTSVLTGKVIVEYFKTCDYCHGTGDIEFSHVPVEED